MTTTALRQIQSGWKAYDNTGNDLGTVREVGDGYFVLEKGLLMPRQYFVPANGIMEVQTDQEAVILDCTKDELDTMGWDEVPDTESDLVSDSGLRSGGEVRSGETQRVARYEEELRAVKRSEAAGEVSVRKDVTEERQEFDVPVTREGVEVRRVAVDRAATGSEDAFAEGDTIRVPVRAERVEVTKEPRVVEEIEIRKTAREDTERVGDTVRKERVDVQRSGDVNVDDHGTHAGWTEGRDRGGDRSGGGIRDHGGDTEAAGGAVGAAGGAVVGGTVAGPAGAAVGGVAGALGGAAAGDTVDRDEDEDA